MGTLLLAAHSGVLCHSCPYHVLTSVITARVAQAASGFANYAELSCEPCSGICGRHWRVSIAYCLAMFQAVR